MGIGTEMLLWFGWLYFGIGTLLIWGVVGYATRRRPVRAFGCAIFLGLLLYWPGKNMYEQRKESEARSARSDQSRQIFESHCGKAGVHIYRTAKDVRGVVLMKPRIEGRADDQYGRYDPYGDILGAGDRYIQYFLAGKTISSVPIGQKVEPSTVFAYEFVEIADASGSGFYRYSTPVSKYRSIEGGKVPLERTAIPSRTARYGITWEDLSTREDRDHWIAGSSLKIVDLDTNEVMAERIGYMYDPAQGSSANGGAPWKKAMRHSCPDIDSRVPHFDFFFNVLPPTLG